jgi:hypothetical protein
MTSSARTPTQRRGIGEGRINGSPADIWRFDSLTVSFPSGRYPILTPAIRLTLKVKDRDPCSLD